MTDLSENQTDNYIWERLSPEWESKLLSHNFVIKNSLGDGNCQFRSIETALSHSGCKTNHMQLRKKIVKYINSLDDKDFFHLIHLYRIEKQNGEFIGNWDPFNIKNKRSFNNELKKPGFHFQGDNITLSLVSRALNIDFIILDNNFNIINLSNSEQPQPKIIILYYHNVQLHYQTIGLNSKNKTITIFKRHQLPNEIDILLDKDYFLLKHIQQQCITRPSSKSNKIQLNKLIKQIENTTRHEMSRDDKLKIMQILNIILQNENFFTK